MFDLISNILTGLVNMYKVLLQNKMNEGTNKIVKKQRDFI